MGLAPLGRFAMASCQRAANVACTASCTVPSQTSLEISVLLSGFIPLSLPPALPSMHPEGLHAGPDKCHPLMSEEEVAEALRVQPTLALLMRAQHQDLFSGHTPEKNDR